MTQDQDPFERCCRCGGLKTAGDEENSQRGVERAEARGRRASGGEREENAEGEEGKGG